MNFRKKLLARTAAATTSLGVGLAGAVVLTAAPAQAALTETNYGFQATSYGTRVVSDLIGLSSDRTAWSYISCTRIAGLKHSNSIASVNLPASDPVIQVGAVTSKTRTWKNKAAGIRGATSGTNTIASVSLGSESLPARLSIKGLETTSTAWADKDGKLHAKNDITAAKIELFNVSDPNNGNPLSDLFDALNGGISAVLQALQENLGTIEIPGLGELSVGYDRVKKGATFASAEAAVLQVHLYGGDTVKGGGDDSVVTIGHSWARINKNIPAGIMTGKGFGANVELLDGIVGVGELGLQPLPCRGTDGRIRTSGVAGLNLGNANALTIGAVQGRVSGNQGKTGWAWAWTEGRIASIQLGPLEIRGIVGRANVKQNKAGKIVRKDIKGSSLGEILMDGESMGGFTPETAADIPPMEIPGVAKIEFFKTFKGKRVVRTSAVVITLLDGTPAGSVVRLGNAQTKIQRY